MYRVCMLCDHNITKKPRSRRLLAMLSRLEFDISVITASCSKDEFSALQCEARLFSFELNKSSKDRSKAENEAILGYCKNGEFDKLIFLNNRMLIRDFLNAMPEQNLLIIEDITLLPFGVEYKNAHKDCKILIDLREFYPLEYENDSAWLASMGRFFTHLCEVYLPFVDMALSVSNGLCARYKREFKIKCELFLSLPPYFEIAPREISTKEPFKILYHGFISPDRSSFELLEIAQHLVNAELFVMALSNQKGFLESFTYQAQGIKNLHIIPPVPMECIIPQSAQYDIGIIPFKPLSFNLNYCMPNKLFEYIQSRLMLLSTPLAEVSEFIKNHNVGIVAEGFCVKEIAKAINELDSMRMNAFKAKANELAKIYHIARNEAILKRILNKILN